MRRVWGLKVDQLQINFNLNRAPFYNNSIPFMLLTCIGRKSRRVHACWGGHVEDPDVFHFDGKDLGVSVAEDF